MKFKKTSKLAITALVIVIVVAYIQNLREVYVFYNSNEIIDKSSIYVEGNIDNKNIKSSKTIKNNSIFWDISANYNVQNYGDLSNIYNVFKLENLQPSTSYLATLDFDFIDNTNVFNAINVGILDYQPEQQISTKNMIKLSDEKKNNFKMIKNTENIKNTKLITNINHFSNDNNSLKLIKINNYDSKYQIEINFKTNPLGKAWLVFSFDKDIKNKKDINYDLSKVMLKLNKGVSDDNSKNESKYESVA